MPLVSMKEMLNKAYQEHYAVGQFNINNVEWTAAILDEAQALKTPVILGVTSGAAKYMGGWNTVVGLVKGLMIDHKITIPVALHVDHGDNVDVCKAAIDAGFTRDLYAALGEQLDSGAWAVRIYYKPFVRWIWFGGVFMAIGGVLAMLDKRYRFGRRDEEAKA